MRHYEREHFRHLDDGERYRDYEYVAYDGWDPRAFAPERIFDERREDGQARRRRREVGTHRDIGGRPVAEASRFARWRRATPRAVLAAVVDTLRHPGAALRRVVGLLHGVGAKGGSRSDARLYDEVCGRLADHDDIDATDIEVTIDNGEVTLAGEVPDRRTKYLAEEVAEDVLGVHDVHNRLRPRRMR